MVREVGDCVKKEKAESRWARLERVSSPGLMALRLPMRPMHSFIVAGLGSDLQFVLRDFGSYLRHVGSGVFLWR